MLTAVERQRFFSRRALHLIMMPTEQCNFRCVYCYEDFELGRMPPQVVAAVKALIQRRLDELDFLCMEWFGGEPLLAVETVLAFHDWLRQVRDRRPGLRLVGQMTTNAYLLRPPLFRRLLAAGVDTYQICLDGPRETHDRMRLRADGEGTFDQIWANLVAMREESEPFDVLIRVHATRDNFAALPGFVSELAATFGSDPRFSVTLRSIEKLGGVNDRHLALLDEGGRRELAALSAIAAGGHLTVHPGPFAKPGALQGCYASAASSYVIRANGEVAKCTVALRHPENRVGVLRDDGTVELDSAKMLGWMRGVFSGDEETLACPMNGFVERRDWEGPPPKGLVQLGGRTRSPPRSVQVADDLEQAR